MLSCLATLLFSVRDDRLGLTASKILAMGASKWIEHYDTKKNRYDPITEGEAAGVYAGCIRERFAPSWKKLSVSTRTRLTGLAKACAGFKSACFSIQFVENGGGTIYSHIERITVIDDAELMEAMVRAKRPKTPLNLTAMNKLWSEADSWVQAHQTPNMKVKEGIAAIGDVSTYLTQAKLAETTLDQIRKTSSKSSFTERALLANYCVRWTRPIVGE